MLNKEKLQTVLPINGLGCVVHFHKQIGSTNDEALKLARTDAPHGTVIVADEQTEGRGRVGRSWSTPPGSAVAMSLILRPESFSARNVGELTVMGALATVEAFGKLGVPARIKWPNDVLISKGKAAGILVEGGWVDDVLVYAVMGIGINVHSESVPPVGKFEFPAAFLEDELQGRIDRLEVIQRVIEALGNSYSQLGTGALQSAWEDKLAYKGETITIEGSQMKSTGKLLGITDQGQLRLQMITGEVLQIGVGGQQLRPVDRM